MEKPVSAADANRKFSKLLRTVREGHSYVVTSHGKAVAKIVPVEKNGEGSAWRPNRPREATAIRADRYNRPLEPG